MSILKIAKLGHPILRQRAMRYSVKERKELIKNTSFIEDIVATLDDLDPAGKTIVGIAAPQVHKSKQLFVARISRDDEKKC